jgi:hypothetical protein
MKIPSDLSVACCTAFLMAAAAPVARSASNALQLSDAEPQYASRLCWAAADVLAVNQFYKQCPATPPPGFFPTSQAVDVGWVAWHTSSPNPPIALLNGYISGCETTFQGVNCNYFGNPPLRGLTFKTGFSGQPASTGTDSTGLTWAAAKQEIDAGRPFLFSWNYPADGTSSSSPVGLHQLVATGYSDERDSSGTQWLQIWDPWPVPTKLVSSVPACGPAPGVNATARHSQWIRFSTYGDPVSDMGITAEHASDQWDLAMEIPAAPVLTIDGTPAAPLPPSPIPFHRYAHPPQAPLSQLRFAKAVAGALPQSLQINLQVSGAAPRSLDVPFPIVGLGFQQLLSAQKDPVRLLAGTTSAILFPVLSQGEVVDAFLVLFIEGRWQRAGYANVEITQRLVDVRARYAAQQHLPLDSFYMVSVPGEVAFFAAHGKGTAAVLIPASTDPSIGAVAGEPVPANQQLSKLILAVQHDLQRHPDRGRYSASPNHG